MYLSALTLATGLLGWLSLSLPALSIPAQEPPRALTLDESCRVAFDALATENYALLLERFPSASEMQAIVDSHLSALSAEQQKKSKESMEARGGIEGVRQRALANFEKRLRTTRAEVAKRLTWSNASYLSALPLVEKPQKLAGTPFEMVAVEFLVWADGEVWSFGARDVVHGPRGYMFSEFVSFLGPRAREKSRDDEELFKIQEDVTKLERSLLAAKEELTQAEGKLAQMSAMTERDREYAAVLRSELEAREANYQEAFDRWRKQEGEMSNKLQDAAREAESGRDEVKRLEQKVVDRDASAAMREEEVALEKHALAEELRHAEQRAQAWEFRAHLSQGELEHLETGAQAVGLTLPRAPQQWLREIPAWIAPVADEPSWRSSLRSRLSRGATCSNGETPVAWVLEYLQIVSQARFVLLPSLAITASERRVLFDTVYEDLAALLERAVEPSSIRVHEGSIFIGTTEELSALDNPFWTKATTTELALQGELKRLATSWNKLNVFTSIDKSLDDVLQMARRVYGIDL